MYAEMPELRILKADIGSDTKKTTCDIITL